MEMTTDTAVAPKKRGRPSVYGPKCPPTRTSLLTAFAKEILAAAAARGGDTESNVVEHLLRCYGHTVTEETFSPLA